MTVNNIGQLFNEKLTDINSRIPGTQNVNNKFKSLLEEVQLKSSDTTPTQAENTASNTETDDAVSLLKNMMATNSYLSTTNSLFSSDTTNSSSIFPTSTFNNSINTLQQNLLLKALEKNENKE